MATKKVYRYRVKTWDDDVLGDWTDVLDDPSFYNEINSLSYNMTLKLARNELSTPATIKTLTTRAGKTLTTRATNPLAVFTRSGASIGAGQPLNVGNKIKITSYTSTQAPLLTKIAGSKVLTGVNGTPILVGTTDDDKDIFRGYVGTWDLDLGSEANTEVTLVSDGTALVKATYLDIAQVGDTPTFNQARIVFTVQDVSIILRSILNKARTVYGINIKHTAISLPDTGVDTNFTFEAQTFSQAIADLLEVLPDQWYYYIDPHTDTFHLKERSTNADVTIRRGVEVIGGNIRTTIEHVINQVLFIGQRVDEDVPNTTHINYEIDQDSIDRYGYGSEVITNDKVQHTNISQLYVNSKLNRFKEPLRDGEIIVVDTPDQRAESYRVGQTIKLVGYGSIVGSTLYQIVAVDFTPTQATLRLNYLLPTVNKRLVAVQTDIGNIDRRERLKET